MDKKNLIIDVVALVVYLIVANPAITGIAVHEWVALGIFVVFLIHCIMHADWIIETIKATPAHPSLMRTGNLILDILILGAFMVSMVSGVLVSGTVLPALGIYAEGYYFWDPLHATSAKMMLALLLVHVVVHWKWIARIFKRDKKEGEKK